MNLSKKPEHVVVVYRIGSMVFTVLPMPRFESHIDFKDYKLIFAIQINNLFSILMFINLNDKANDKDGFCSFEDDF